MVVVPLDEKPTLAQPPQMELLGIVSGLHHVGQKVIILEHGLDHTGSITGLKCLRKIGGVKAETALANEAALSYNTRMSRTATRAGARHTQPFDLKRYLETRTEAVNRALDRFLPKESTKPS